MNRVVPKLKSLARDKFEVLRLIGNIIGASVRLFYSFLSDKPYLLLFQEIVQKLKLRDLVQTFFGEIGDFTCKFSVFIFYFRVFLCFFLLDAAGL